MDVRSESFTLTLTNESAFDVGSADNLRAYDRAHDFTNGYGAASRHGVRCRRTSGKGADHSCILLAAGGATTVHEHSAVLLGERCYVAVGPMLCALALPGLDLIWATKVDTATCFGVYQAPGFNCLLSHGEVEIAGVNLDGGIVWSVGGRDIFIGAFRVEGNFAVAEDFDGHLYRFDIKTGESR